MEILLVFFILSIVGLLGVLIGWLGHRQDRDEIVRPRGCTLDSAHIAQTLWGKAEQDGQGS